MSAWYIFSAMGFYPFNPCGGEYVIGAPQVPKVTIHFCHKDHKELKGELFTNDNCHNCSQITNTNLNPQLTTHNSTRSTCSTRLNTFTIIARDLSKENKYVKSVTLNGKPVTDWKIRHADIMSGGELVFEMYSGAMP